MLEVMTNTAPQKFLTSRGQALRPSASSNLAGLPTQETLTTGSEQLQCAAKAMSSFEQENPDIWSSAAHHKIPEDAWEYHTRKALNDAAYKELQYVPYSSTMPVQAKADEPKFMWKKKGAH